MVTSLSTDRASAAQGLDLYRFRWQIELAFQRMKGLLELGVLPAKEPRLSRTIIYSKLLAALLLDDFTERFLAISPGATHCLDRPPSLWRIQRALCDSLQVSVLGVIPMVDWLEAAPRLLRHLWDRPRKRRKQSAAALAGRTPIHHTA